MKKCTKYILKILASIFCTLLAIITIFSVSPIYDFKSAGAFSGPDIFDPYASYVDSLGWKRANFHTHTRVKGILNECKYWPLQVDSCYRSFGYDIVTFSNHNQLTEHPYAPELKVNVYEHGYGFFKFHKLVFGSDRVWCFDHLLPFLASQRQFQLDMLGRDCDFIQLNHPFRTICSTKSIMQRLSGYNIMELDSGVTDEQEYWDWALSSGHYSFGLANDDLHFPDESDCFAVRCNFLNCPDGRYESIKSTLLGGCYYSMRVPDFGDGNWDMKREKNAELPRILSIGASKDTIYIRLDRKADMVVLYGQDHRILTEIHGGDCLEYIMRGNDSYARFQAYFKDGTVIYSNPFARYDKSEASMPLENSSHCVNYLLTALFNIGLLLLLAGICLVLRQIWKCSI